METAHLTPYELCQRWGVRLSTLARWRTEGIGPVYLKLGNLIRYRPEDVSFYECNCLRLSTSERKKLLEKHYQIEKEEEDESQS